MAIKCNTLALARDNAAFDRRFDVYEVSRHGQGKLSWTSRAFEKGGQPYILAILGQGGDRPFYLLTHAGATNPHELRGRFEELGDQTGAGGKAEENPAAIRDLHPEPVRAEDLDDRQFVQLLLNALGSLAGAEAGACAFQNVTGHLYCLLPGGAGVRRRKGEAAPYQVCALEMAVNDDLQLKADVTTFTRADQKLRFPTKPKSAYARYVIDLAAPGMRREEPGERRDDAEVFIIKQFEGAKSSIPFLKYDRLTHFERSKCGVIHETLGRFNETYRGIARISLSDVDESETLDGPPKLVEQVPPPIWFAGKRVAVVCADEGDAELVRARGEVARSLAAPDMLGAEPLASGEGADFVFTVLHKSGYYKEHGLEDPYHSCEVQGAVNQHLTAEEVLEKDKRAFGCMLLKSLQEATVKSDLREGRMTLYDWGELGLQEPLTFAVPGPRAAGEDKRKSPARYSLMRVRPDGAFDFSLVGVCGPASETAAFLAEEWSSKVDGYLLDEAGGLAVIEYTDGWAMPDVGYVHDFLANNEWAFGKDDMLGVLSVSSGNEAVDEVLRGMCELVAGLPEGPITRGQLDRLLRQATEGQPGQVKKKARSAISENFACEFGKTFCTCLPRDRQTKQRAYGAMLKTHCLREENGWLYWVGDYKSPTMDGYERGVVMRRVRSVEGCPVAFPDLLRTLAVPIVRLNAPTVLPFPFKYLREWCKLKERELEAR